MRVGLAVVVGVVACGSPQRSQSVGNQDKPDVPARKKPAADPVVAAVRPDVDVEHLVPDFHDELRWPLSMMSHPELEPQFEIAQVFAQPGIGWLELCERGVQNRVQSGRNRDELEYLRGWCSAIKGDADTACSKLKALAASAVLGLSAAARTDLVNIIASAGDLDAADKLITKHRLSDIELFDLLSATYLELGREQDAYEMNRRALDSVGHTTSAAHCRRLVKAIMLGGQSDPAQELEAVATKPKAPDATCVSLHRGMKCRLGSPWDCLDYFHDQGIHPNAVRLLEASRRWPHGVAPAGVWLSLALDAMRAHPVAGSEPYAIAAMEAAYAARGSCGSVLNGLVIDAAKTFVDPVAKGRLLKLLPHCRVNH